MKFHLRRAVAALFVIALAASSVTHAALVDRGGGLIYDTDLNITWLADANYAQTSGFDGEGAMLWSAAMTWAGNLSYGGGTDWRLPTSDTACAGYNCTGSEMGHLFYTELGGTAGSSILSSTDPDLALFTNVQSDNYWSGTEYAPNTDTDGARIFNFNDGSQTAYNKGINLYAWAVRPGDVAAVPLPATAWLFGSGLLGLLGAARARRRR